MDWLHGGAESLLTITNLFIGGCVVSEEDQSAYAAAVPWRLFPAAAQTCSLPLLWLLLEGREVESKKTRLVLIRSHLNTKHMCVDILFAPSLCSAVLGLRQGIREAEAANKSKAEQEAQQSQQPPK